MQRVPEIPKHDASGSRCLGGQRGCGQSGRVTGDRLLHPRNTWLNEEFACLNEDGGTEKKIKNKSFYS